jgi:hypothetical protein
MRRITMSELTPRMNMVYGDSSDRDNAYSLNITRDSRKKIHFYDTLCLICAEQDVNLDNVTEDDFYSASLALEDFINSANEESGYNVLVWFDEEVA